MRVFITGGTGTIGRRLAGRLLERGDTPVVLSRHADKARLNPALKGVELVQGDPAVAGPWDAAVDGCDAVVNLAGENLFARRWDADVKRAIRDSRVYATEHIVDAIRKASSRPRVLVQGSAIGFYGPRGDEALTEADGPGDDFMAKVCIEWEDAAKPVEALGTRLATLRTGVVLAKGEGALGVMTPIFKLGPGAPIGSGGGPIGKGQQWMSWIHVDDIVGLILHALDNDKVAGPLNGTAPNPVRNAEFSKTFSQVLWKPTAFWRVYVPFGPPDALLKLVLGEVADVVVKGQKVLPARAQATGYTFKFPHLEAALREIFGGTKPEAKPTPEPAVAGVGG